MACTVLGGTTTVALLAATRAPVHGGYRLRRVTEDGDGPALAALRLLRRGIFGKGRASTRGYTVFGENTPGLAWPLPVMLWSQHGGHHRQPTAHRRHLLQNTHLQLRQRAHLRNLSEKPEP